MKAKLTYLKYLIFLLPLFLFVSYFKQQDTFILFLAGVTLLISLVLVLPQFGSPIKINLKFKKTNIGNFPKTIKRTNFFANYKTKTKIKESQNSKKTGLNILFLIISLIASSSFFLYLLVYKLEAITAKNVLLSYYQSLFNRKLLITIIAGFLIFTILRILICKLIINRQVSWIKTAISSLVVTIIIFILGSHLALGKAIGYKIWQLQDLASKIKNNPESAGVYIGMDKVVEKLNQMDKPPKIKQELWQKEELGRQLAELNFSAGKFNTFYTKTLVDQLPKILWPKFEMPEAKMMIIGNYLLIFKLDKAEMQAIGPRLGYLLVKNYFDPRSIKDKPSNYAVLNRQEYLEFRDKQINKELAEIDSSISKLGGQIASLRAQATQVIISYYRLEIDVWEAIRRLDNIDARIADIQAQQAELRIVRNLVEAQKQVAPQELGLFLPEEEMAVKVVLDFDNAAALQDHLATLVHEYLHYTSYVNEERRLISFFEEGLTEYYSQEVLKKETGIESRLGYPVIVSVIRAMVKKLPKDKLEEAYFTKDEAKIKELLNEAYGENFYEDTEVHFFMIAFSPADKAVKLANDVLSEIGGQQIKLEDIMYAYPKEES